MRRLALPVLLALSLSAAACGPGRGRYGHPAHHAERATVAGTEVSDAAFAGAVRDLLASEPATRERQLRLQGVVARQMIRVADRYDARQRDRALASFAGAMYLVRAGELTTPMLGPKARDALRDMAGEYAQRGDEGRARAAYEMLLRVAPASEKAGIQGHLDAIAAWTRDTAGGVMETAGALESAAVTRHLLEPSVEARDDAVAKTVDFVRKADAVRKARHSRGAQITRREGLEAVRALETGTTVLIAIFLRDVDAQGALDALDSPDLRDDAPTELVQALEAVVDQPDSQRWLQLARLLRPSSSARSDFEDFGRDMALLQVAAFEAACEAFRLDSTSPEPAAFVAATLVELGMGEAAPAVLADAAKVHKDPRIAGLALALTMQAMQRALDAGEPDTARRAFKAAAPILKAADARGGQVHPSPARVYAMMGEIEIREGRLDDARKLLSAAAERDRSGVILFSLARLDRHDQKPKEALDRLNQALAADGVAKSTPIRAEILLLKSDVLREQGDVKGAREPLADALRDLAAVRAKVEGSDRARVERLIAQALDRFGASESAGKALDRAMEAAPHDERQAAATVGQIVARAFVAGDLEGAREGLSRGLGADLEAEDLVYYAMWVHMLEEHVKSAKADDTAKDVLVRASADPRWIGKIAAFGAGRLRAEQLLAAAQTPPQKTEALFYTAMTRKLAGDKSADADLQKVVRSPGLDLMEVQLAREILAGPSAHLPGPPPDVGLP